MKKEELKVTQSGYDKLLAELEEAKTKIRREIADRIDYARGFGDLSENSAYHAAMEDRRHNEKRIRELEDMISRAKVVESATNGEISLGSKVTVIYDGKEFDYEIVGATEANPAAMKVSNESPIGAALMDHKKGEKVVVTLPMGDREFEIVNIK